MKTAYIIDLYTGKAEILPEEELVPATQGLKKWETPDAITYKGEEYLVMIPKN